MKIDTIKIENIRSYDNQTIPLDNGITVITGPNGSGKSSSLEAMFIALYGNKAIVAKDQKVGDFINNASNDGGCEVQFKHLGHDYTIERKYGINNQGNASNKKSLLKKDGNFLAEQFKDTYAEICDILNMDENAFRNCVYIRQGEIDILINASPAERQKMIDDLLQIGVLEDYHSRSKNALTSVKRMVRDVENIIKTKTSEIKEIEDKNPNQQLAALKNKETELSTQLQELQKKKDLIEERKSQILTQISNYEKDIKDKTDIESKMDESKKQRSKLNDEIKELTSRINEIYAEIENLKNTIDDLCQKIEISDVTLEDIDDVTDSFEKSVNNAYQKATNTQSQIDNIVQDIESKEKQQTKSNEDISKLNESINDTNEKINEYRLGINKREDEKKTIEERISDIYQKYSINSLDELKEYAKKTKLNEDEALKTLNEIKSKGQSLSNNLESHKKQESDVQEQIKEENNRQTEISNQIEEAQNKITENQSKINENEQQIKEKTSSIRTIMEKNNLDSDVDISNESLAKIQNALTEERIEINGNQTEISNQIVSLKKEQDSCENQELEINEQITEENNRLTEISNQIEEAQKKIAENQSKINENEQQIKEKTSSIRTILEKNNLDSDVAISNESLSKIQNALTEERIEINSSKTEISNKIDLLEKQKDKEQDLLEQGICPTCNQKIDSKHFHENINETTNEINSLSEKLSEVQNKLDRNKYQTESIQNAISIYSKIKNLQSEIESFEIQIDASKQNLEKLQNTYSESTDKIQILQNKAKHFHDRINEIIDERNELSDKLTNIKGRLDENKNKSESIQSALSVHSTINGLQSDIETLKVKIDSTKQNMENLQKTYSESIDKLQKLKEKEGSIQDAIHEIGKQITDVNEKIQAHEIEYNKRKDIHAEYERVVESLSADFSRKDVLKSEIKGFNENIENLNLVINQNKHNIAELKKAINDTKDQISRLSEQKQSLEVQKEHEDNEYSAEKEKYSTARSIRTHLQKVESCKSEIANKNNQIQNKNSTINVYINQITEYKENINKIKERIANIKIEDLRSRLNDFKDASTKHTEKIKDINNENNDLQQQIGNVNTSLERLDELKTEREKLNNELDYLSTISEDVEILDTTYMQTRTEIRAKNINTLNKYINEMFNLMSIDSAYSHVMLDHDYNIQIFKKDGTPLDPKQLSGGERAILNIVFRCAIYRLLAHGFSSESSESLPPIIMDEPTTFLDREHVKQLIQLLDTMKSLGVNQILVVTHDDTLIDAADTVYRVEKDSTTNISKMYKTAEAKLDFAV